METCSAGCTLSSLELGYQNPDILLWLPRLSFWGYLLHEIRVVRWSTVYTSTLRYAGEFPPQICDILCRFAERNSWLKWKVGPNTGLELLQCQQWWGYLIVLVFNWLLRSIVFFFLVIFVIILRRRDLECGRQLNEVVSLSWQLKVVLSRRNMSIVDFHIQCNWWGYK